MLGKSGFDEGMENLSEYIILIYFYGDTQGAILHGKIFLPSFLCAPSHIRKQPYPPAPHP